MSKFQEEEFINLGKQLYEKELLDKQYQKNYDLLKERFNRNVEIEISKKEFQENTIDTIVWNLQEDFDIDGDEISTLMYPRILEHKITDLENEIERTKEAQQDLDDMNNTYLEEIDILEKRIERGKAIVSTKNDKIYSLNLTIQRQQKEINEWFYLTIFLLLNFVLCFTNSQVYSQFWSMFFTGIFTVIFESFTFLSNIIIMFFSWLFFFLI